MLEENFSIVGLLEVSSLSFAAVHAINHWKNKIIKWQNEQNRQDNIE